MRKLLLSFATLIFALISYFPSFGQTSQNLLTPTGKGFEYKFAGTAVDNCSPGGTDPTYPITESSVWLDLYGLPSTYFEITSLGGGSIVYKIKTGTPANTFLKIRFPNQSCGFSSEVVDLSSNANYKLDITSSAAVAVNILGLGNMPEGSGLNATWADKDFITTNLTAGNQTVSGTFPQLNWSNTSANLAQSGGWGIQLASDVTSDITLTINSAQFGDAALLPEINIVDFLTGSTYNFGNQKVDESSNYTFTIQNTGTEILNITRDVSGTDFTLLESSPTTIEAGESATVTVIFTPSSTGVKSGTLVINSNDPDEAIYTINLTGNGVVPSPDIEVKQGTTVLANDGSADFGSVNVGSNKELTFTVSNNGDALLIYNLATIASSNEMVVTSPETLSGSLVQGASIDVKVTFTPQGTGTRTGTFFIGSNDSDEDEFTVKLTGTGVATTAIQSFEQANASIYIQDNSWIVRGLKNGTYAVHIVSVDGRSNVSNAVISGNDYVLPTSALGSGLYTVIMTDGASSIRGKIIVK